MWEHCIWRSRLGRIKKMMMTQSIQVCLEWQTRSPYEVSSSQNSWWVTASLGIHKKYTNIRILKDTNGKYQESQNLNACPQNAIILSLKHVGIQESSKKKTEQFGIEMAKGRIRIPVWWVANICFSHCWVAHGPLPSSSLIWIRNKEIPHIRWDRMPVQKPQRHLCKISTALFCQVHMVLCPFDILPSNFLLLLSPYISSKALGPIPCIPALPSIGLLLCLYLRIIEVRKRKSIIITRAPYLPNNFHLPPSTRQLCVFPLLFAVLVTAPWRIRCKCHSAVSSSRLCKHTLDCVSAY